MTQPISVALRVRPFSHKEQANENKEMVSLEGPIATVLTNPSQRFRFNLTFPSLDTTRADYSSQQDVFQNFGLPATQQLLGGYNGSLFAYGPTGTGKSYTMMGMGTSAGLIPRIVEDLFQARAEAGPDVELRIRASYLEVYNDQVRDLLSIDRQVHELAVKDHPRFGVFIPGLTEAACLSCSDVQQLLEFGMKKRVTTSTHMNSSSSRSHAIFCIRVQRFDGPMPEPGDRDVRQELSAWLQLSDLAGSERQAHEGRDLRLLEGVSINQSLSSLATVVKDLGRGGRGASQFKVSFGASKLTMLLKEALMGNCNTYMIATVSPSVNQISETVNTLRFAEAVGKLTTSPVRNMESQARVAEQLQKELLRMRVAEDCVSTSPTSSRHQQATMAAIEGDHVARAADLEQLLSTVHAAYDMQVRTSMELKRGRTAVILQQGLSTSEISKERTALLLKQGIPTSEAITVDSTTPYLLNMNDDPMVAGCLIYFLQTGWPTTIGSAEDSKIVCRGIGVSGHLCQITNSGNVDIVVQKVSATGRVGVNGRLLREGECWRVSHADKIYIGRAFAFRLIVPSQDDGTKDRSLSFDGLDDEWCSIEESQSWASLQVYSDQVLAQMHPTQAHKLFAEMKRGCKLCDEANEITSECRANEELQFEVDLTASVPSSIVVRVLQAENTLPSEDQLGYTTVHIWSVAQMAERLERMRDYHEVWMQNGHVEVDPLMDPWHEVHPGMVTLRLQELEKRWLRERESAASAGRRTQGAFDRCLRVWQAGDRVALLRDCVACWADETRIHREAKPKALAMSVRRMEIENAQADALTSKHGFDSTVGATDTSGKAVGAASVLLSTPIVDDVGRATAHPHSAFVVPPRLDGVSGGPAVPVPVQSWRPAAEPRGVPVVGPGDRAPQRLMVKIVAARGLLQVDPNTGGSRHGEATYCVCVVRPLDDRPGAGGCKTRTAFSQQPEWNEIHEIDGWIPGEHLEFTLYDRGVMGSRLEGRALLAGDRIGPSGFEGELPIQGQPNALLNVSVRPLGIYGQPVDDGRPMTSGARSPPMAMRQAAGGVARGSATLSPGVPPLEGLKSSRVPPLEGLTSLRSPVVEGSMSSRSPRLDGFSSSRASALNEGFFSARTSAENRGRWGLGGGGGGGSSVGTMGSEGGSFGPLRVLSGAVSGAASPQAPPRPAAAAMQPRWSLQFPNAARSMSPDRGMNARFSWGAGVTNMAANPRVVQKCASPPIPTRGLIQAPKPAQPLSGTNPASPQGTVIDRLSSAPMAPLAAPSVSRRTNSPTR